MKKSGVALFSEKVLGWDELRNQGMKFQNIFYSASLFGIHKDEIV